MRTLVASLLALTLAACGGGYTGNATYVVKLKQGDVSGALIANDEHVGPGDAQWTRFLADASAALGQAPESFEVTGVKLQLDPTRSKNVGGIEQALSGAGAVFLRQEGGLLQVDVATFEGLEGSAQESVDATGEALTPVFGSLAAGDFRLGVRGDTTRTPAEDFEAGLLVTLEVEAR